MESDQHDTVAGKGEDQSGRPPLLTLPDFPLSIEDMVARLEDLVHFALECENKPLNDEVSFVDVFKQLGAIRMSIDSLTQEQQKLLAALSATAAQIPGLSIAPDNDSEHTKVLGKIKYLHDICESAKDRIHTTLQRRPEGTEEISQQIKDSEISEKKKQIRRKGKFRAVGGKKGWMPT